MKIRGLCSLLPVVALLMPSLCQAQVRNAEIPDSLQNYVARVEPDYAWKVDGHDSLEQGTVHRLELTSQKWQDIVWKHALYIYEPAKIDYPEHVLLFVTGGSIGGKPGRGDMAMGLQLAQLTGSRVATLHQVPNQPLFDNRKEDDLITETWLRYLETGDETWPLLFPMVKSAVKAMDAIQEFSAQELNQSVKGFVITGASKRGWTSWLTPVADQRVIATAPIVIDTLNFRPQMKHQLEAWGAYSEQIYDYTSKGLVKQGDDITPREERLWTMMDPYTYRSTLTLPKLLVNGTNDPYWVVDAMKFYWNDLAGPKYVLQVPNAGHGLDGGREHALATIAAFFRYAASGTALPDVNWTNGEDESGYKLALTSDVDPEAVNLWTAHSATTDFRKSEWTAVKLDGTARNWTAGIPRAKNGHVAFYCELQFEKEGVPYSLCTIVTRK